MKNFATFFCFAARPHISLLLTRFYSNILVLGCAALSAFGEQFFESLHKLEQECHKEKLSSCEKAERMLALN